MKHILALAALIFSTQAFAGTSVTRLACSSPDGRYIISGYVPGQGEVDVSLRVSNRADIAYYEGSGVDGDVDLKAHSASIVINQKGAVVLTLKSTSTKLKSGWLGVSGSFVAKMTGLDPANNKPLAPVTMRCYADDSI